MEFSVLDRILAISLQSCETFAILTLFICSKIAWYDYCSGFEKLTDNVGLSEIEVDMFVIHIVSLSMCFDTRSLQHIFAHSAGMTVPHIVFMVTNQDEIFPCSGVMTNKLKNENGSGTWQRNLSDWALTS